MTRPLVISGDYADLKTVKTRSVVQLIVECPIEDGERIVRMFGFPQPGNPTKVAVARLVEGATENKQVEKRSFGELPAPQQAGIACGDIRFQTFLTECRTNFWRLALSRNPTDRTEAAAAAVRALCKVNSRADLGTNPEASLAWDALYGEYQQWART